VKVGNVRGGHLRAAGAHAGCGSDQLLKRCDLLKCSSFAVLLSLGILCLHTQRKNDCTRNTHITGYLSHLDGTLLGLDK
jgi:hypothetical protein